MKRFLAVLAFLAGMNGLTQAQTTDSSSQKNSSRPGEYQPTAQTGVSQAAGARKQVTPTKRAAHQLNVLQEKLNLNQDQVIQLNMILLNRETSLDSLKTNQSGDRKSDMRFRRDLVRGADRQINALLTDEQKKLYQQWKDTQKEERLEKRKGGAPAPPPGQ